jgi:N-acetylglucosaminyldiphosphoundecaprenol N-acetyl-beta-D-mannosaminyltransferase
LHPRTIEVLGVPVAVVGTEDVLQFVRVRIERRHPAQIVTVNAEFVVLARKNQEFARVLREADLSTPDSYLIVRAMRGAGADLAGRVGGSDLIWQISAQAASEGFRLFLLGGAEGVAVSAATRLEQRYPGLVVAGTYSGSPDPREQGFIVDLIRRSKADILFVAFGAPHQDIWIARNLRETGVVIAMGVGGSFDYVSGQVRRAPVWMRERGLEWLWRLALQPWRWRRMLALPQFIWLMWRSRAPALQEERTNQ